MIQRSLNIFSLDDLRHDFLHLLLTPRTPAQKQPIVTSTLMRPLMSTQVEAHDRRDHSGVVALRDLRITILVS